MVQDSEGKEITWMMATDQIRGRFRLGAKLNMPVTHNAIGADAIYQMMTQMAQNLDKATEIIKQNAELALLQKKLRKNVDKELRFWTTVAGCQTAAMLFFWMWG